jgi:3-oxoacyl-(acyl-carrier-protein) synthase
MRLEQKREVGRWAASLVLAALAAMGTACGTNAESGRSDSARAALALGERTGETGAAATAAAQSTTGGADTPPAPGRSRRSRVVLLGTSLTAGLGLDPDVAYPALLQRKADSAGYDVRIVNAGLSGETSAGALRRAGWVLDQPAAMVVLEELEHAKRRGAKIHGELLGYGSTADAYRITDTHPEGRGASACIRMALADAGIGADTIDYINAHGTSTDVNDKVETLAIKTVFGERAYKIPVSSTKSMMGHLIAAAGATELIVCLLAIRDGIVPPTINYENPDPNCDLDYVPNVARVARCERALSNSFGFGGQNISLVVGRYTG